MAKITIVDIQHKQFKKKLNGYDPADVDQFLDEIIETLEDEAHQRAALEAEISDLRERISHFKAMEDSLQNTLLLAQRTADEVKASAHKEADLIRYEARVSVEKEIASFGDRAAEARREFQRALETSEKAKSELRSLLMTHLSLLEKTQINITFADPAKSSAPEPDKAVASERPMPVAASTVAAASPVAAASLPISKNGNSTVHAEV
jgi:cell division initiation protein